MSNEEIKLIVDDYMMNLYIRLNVVKKISNKNSLYFLNDLIDSYDFIINNKSKLSFSIEVFLYHKQFNHIDCYIRNSEFEKIEFNPEFELLTRYLLTGIGDYEKIKDEYITFENRSFPF
jgi:hypothetical protein